jgi:hypothetical protein
MIERVRRKRFFSRGAGNFYAGVYKTFEEARKAIPPRQTEGFDNEVAAGFYRERLEKVFPADYPALFWLKPLIKESTRRVADGAQLSEKAGESLARIVQGVQETAASIAKIAQATREQSEASNEVNKAIQNVSSITETNASSSEELSASAEELGAQAATLKNVISGFKV